MKRIPDWFLTVFVPLAFFALTLFIEREVGMQCFTACEDGPVENAQALIMFSAFCVGLGILRMDRKAYPDWVRLFFAIGVFASLYVALEEISYGQRIFGWVTPDSWGLVNDQHETNLHNTSAWFDQKPRLIVEIGVIIGGLIIPALRRWKPALLPQKFSIVYPSSALVVTAAVAVFIHVYDSVTELMGRQDLFYIDRGSEMQEIYLFWFILLYFIFKRRELTSSARAR